MHVCVFSSAINKILQLTIHFDIVVIHKHKTSPFMFLPLTALITTRSPQMEKQI